MNNKFQCKGCSLGPLVCPTGDLISAYLEVLFTSDGISQTQKSEVPSWDSSPNFELRVFFRNSFFNQPPIPPGKVFVSYVGDRFIYTVSTKKEYFNS